GADPDTLEARLSSLSAQNRAREKASAARGIPLLFGKTCDAFGLDSFERQVLALLFFNSTSNRFEGFRARTPFKDGGRVFTVGDLLRILCPDYREQIRCRRYFSIEGTLCRGEVIFFPERDTEDTENILEQAVSLRDR